jgi:K+-transporting ATPase c subunit
MMPKILRDRVRPVVGLLVIFAIIIMAAYPASPSAIDLVENPGGAIGSPMVCNGTVVGSKLVA